VTRLSQRVHDAAILAGRVAHDFDNLLMGVLGFAELAAAQTEPGTQANDLLAELQKVAQRGLVTTRQMHDLSRGGRFTPTATRLTDVWPKVAAGLEIKPAVSIDFEAGLPPVLIAAEPLALVIRHITQNAVEAVNGDGTVSVIGRSVVATEPLVDVLPRPIPAGQYVEVTVTDTGPGMKPQLLEEITTTPLVTTKPKHRGLGLATVYRILDVNGGGVRIEAVRPHGTRVTILLPVAPAAFTVTPPPSGRTATPSASR
jgi:signal transduction histidine kinase